MNLRKPLLAGLLALACGPGAVMWAAAENTAPAAWVVDPAVPGDNLPPAGRSLFDQLFAVDRNGRASIDLPFPFAALLARLDAQLAHEPDSSLPPAKRVLIPLGRSLQRTAAAPDYFAFPRVVVAVDAQPGTNSAPYLKDRLYIGYQEKSAVLEVISYNEAAGRFEFQLVKDYRAGGRPQVVYANRTLCFACHQNGAPIFSRALWDETNANPQAAALLAAESAATRHGFYGIPAGRGVDIPYAIDNATERANDFALTQRLWREACGADDLPARRCRAGLFAAALRHALSGGQAWVPDTDFAQSVAAPLRAETGRRWPGGLAVGDPDLPNRNPLQGLSAWPSDGAARIARSHVPARFDPLLPRQPREIRHPGSPEALAALAAGLAEFVSAPERRQIEAALARQPDVAMTRLTVPCSFAAGPPASRWSLHCATATGQAGPNLAGSVELAGGRPRSGQLTRLTLPGGTALSHIGLAVTGKVSANGATFSPSLGDRLPRSAAGHAITRLNVQRDANDPATGTATLEIREEFAAVDQALAALVAVPAGGGLFAPGVFPRQALFAALLGQLGAPAAPPCCSAALALPAPRLETHAVAPGSPARGPVEPAVQGFYPYCAACHQTAETFPPNFLTGSGPDVAARLRQCAPRLYVRLAMADVAPEHRDKTPMPPESMLPAFASDRAAWRASPARQALLAQVGSWLQAESGRPPDLRQLLAGGYEALRPCLAAP